jgi:hypothetical protein
VAARAHALELDLKRLPPGESKEHYAKLRMKPEGLDLFGRLEKLWVDGAPTDEQLVQFASMLGVSMETHHLGGALLSSCAHSFPTACISVWWHNA